MSTLTAERMAELRTLADAATPGPWTAAPYNGGCQVDAPGLDDCIAEMSEGSDEDAAFIAAARTAVPNLLEEVERLRECQRLVIDDASKRVAHYMLLEAEWREQAKNHAAHSANRAAEVAGLRAALSELRSAASRYLLLQDNDGPDVHPFQLREAREGLDEAIADARAALATRGES